MATTETQALVEDPAQKAVAATYAEALYGAAEANGGKGQADSVIDELGSFVNEVVMANETVREALESPIVTDEARLGLVNRLLGGTASEIFGSFLRVLVQNGRGELLPQVYLAARELQNEKKGYCDVEVLTSVPLSSSLLSEVKSTIEAKLGQTANLTSTVNPDLLGGLVIRVGDVVYDGSVKARVDQLRGQLRQGYLNEIQRGRDRFGNPARN